jgi:hypothetical protein
MNITQSDLMKMQIMIGRIDERTQRTDEILDKIDTQFEKIDSRLARLESKECPNHSKLEKDITSLKINQGKIAADSQLSDEKIRSMVKINSVKVSGLTSIIIMGLGWILDHFKM